MELAVSSGDGAIPLKLEKKLKKKKKKKLLSQFCTDSNKNTNPSLSVWSYHARIGPAPNPPNMAVSGLV
jgi:hypothetical protein